MKNKWGWEEGDLGIVKIKCGFQKYSLVSLKEDDGSDIPWWEVVSGEYLWNNHFNNVQGGRECCSYNYILKVADYFKDQHNPTYNEIQIFEILFPHLTGIIKEKDNA